MLSEDLLTILYLCDPSIPKHPEALCFQNTLWEKVLERKGVSRWDWSCPGRFHSAEVCPRDLREKGPKGWRTLSIYWALPVCHTLSQAPERTHSLCPQRTQSSAGEAWSKLGGSAEGLSWGGGNRRGLNRFSDLIGETEGLINQLWTNDMLSKPMSLINNSFPSFKMSENEKGPYTFP